MSVKNKSQLRDQFKKGKQLFNSRYWFGLPASDPLKFANSSELDKIKNRNRKNK